MPDNSSRHVWEGQSLDVDVKLRALPQKWLADLRAAEGYVEIDGPDIWFVWDQLGVMQIHDGSALFIDPIPNVKPSLLKQAVQSAGLGLILHQRNQLTLHASAVEMDGGVVAFVGYKGAGKSTTAASMFGQGYRLVTDDLLVLKIDKNRTVVDAFPGIPQLRLWPEAVVASLKEDPETLPRNSDLSTKRLRSVGDQFARDALPLKAIYTLDYLADPMDDLVIEPLAPRDACIEMIRQSYALHYLGNQGANAQHLAQSNALTKLVPVRRLRRPRALEAIPEMVAAIERDIGMEAVAV
ncbi:MAG: hypothetical protein AB8G77_28060 [Rhodothermales bacterium]